MDYVEVSVSPTGEIVLPEGLRKSLRVEAGGLLRMRVENGGLVLDSTGHRVARAQALVREHGTAGASASEELIAERRADALRE